MARLLTCDWMGRVWTFQEAVLNQNVSIRFRDGVVDPARVEGWTQHFRDFAPREPGCHIIDKLGSPVLLLPEISNGAAALLDVIEQSDGRKLAKYIAVVGFFEAAPDMTAKFNPTLHHSTKIDSDGNHMTLCGTKISGNEDWCIF